MNLITASEDRQSGEMKGSGCSFSFSAKEKELKRKRSGSTFFYGWGIAMARLLLPEKVNTGIQER